MKNKIFALIFTSLTFLIFPAFAEEAIHSFDSLIQVQTDGSMIVTETLRVHHEGINIRRGIYRDLPTKKGERYELLSVTRNGHYEPSFVERRPGYYRINTGDDSFLPRPATSTFEIKYKVWNIPKAYDGYDEVYWNVTGDEWAFPIESVSARIELPYGADIIQQASYIGYTGSQEPANYKGNGQYSGRYLSPGEQLTVAVGFTPGIVSTEKYTSKEDTLRITIPVVLYFFYLGFLILAWHKKGRDPAGRAIMPQYEPPKELTAAQAACLYDKGMKKNVFVISLIQMISNGFLKLTEKKEKILIFPRTVYILEKTGKTPSNIEEENIRTNKITLDGQYNSGIASLVRQLASKIEKSMKSFYTKNQAWVFLPTMICLLLWVFLYSYLQIGSLETLMVHVFSFFPLLFFFLICKAILQLLKSTLQNFSVGNLISLILFSFFLLQLASFGMAFLNFSKITNSNYYEVMLLPCILFTYFIFSYLLYQPTEKGQRLTEYLEGLKMFLKTTKIPSRERLKIEEKLTQENMEKLFPYAMALNLEEAWAEKFKGLFGLTEYGHFVHSHPYTSTHFIHSFSSSTSHSSGRSGGSGGGGSAGGGGGGGGGGGR